MNVGTKAEKTFVKSVCFFLVLTLFLSLFVFDTGDFIDVPVAEALSTGTDGISMEGKVSDLDTSNFLFVNEADAGAKPPNYQFLNRSANDGRIWTDKSVNADVAYIYDTLGGVVGVEGVRRESTDFLVTYSALSQTVNTKNIIVEPSDTVFVIDVSGSMASNNVPGDGRSRIAVVVEALNNAIAMLMDANQNNRIAVVIYGGQSVSGQNYARAQPVLALGRYNAATPIFSMSGTTTVNVRSGSNTAGTPSPQRSSFTVEGGTPTQLGMRRGAQVLLGVTQGLGGGSGTWFDTGLQDPTQAPGNNIIVTRQPNIILMTDGEPTYAWTDYRLDGLASIDGTDFTYNVGNGSAGDMGLTALTVMTASYIKKLVQDRYYPLSGPGSMPDNSTKNVGFYTIGLGVNSAIANGMLDPYGNSASGVPNAQLVVQGTTNMLTVIDGFAPGTANVTFPALQKGSSTNRPDVTVSNTGGVITCNYDTLSFSAMDKAGLDDAFNQITQQIVNQGNYSTNVGSQNPQFSGYLTFSDVIGEYMEFKEFRGLWYNNTKNPAAAIADLNTVDFRTAFVNQMMSSQYAGVTTGSPTFVDADAAAIIANSITATSNPAANPYIAPGAISYYTNSNRIYTKPVFNATGEFQLPTPGTDMARVDMYVVQAPAKDTVNGTTDTNLNRIIFQVVTIQENGSFASTGETGSTPSALDALAPTLIAGDQIVRWYVPAALIPMRSVEPITDSAGNPIRDDFNNILVQVAESVPLRTIYVVTPNLDKIAHGLTATYSSVNPGTLPNSYYFYTNRWRGTNGVTSRADLANMSLTFFTPNTNNIYYTPPIETRNDIIKQPNPVGPTGTAPFAWGNASFPAAGTSYQIQRLGNNGRIMLQSQLRFNLTKTFTFPDPSVTIDNLSAISFLIAAIDANLNVIGTTSIVFNKNTWNYNTSTGEYSIPIDLPPASSYTIREIGGIPPLGYARDPSSVVVPGPFHAGDTKNVTMSNVYSTSTTHVNEMRIIKSFHGLIGSGSDSQLPTALEITLTGPEGSNIEWIFKDDDIFGATNSMINGGYWLPNSTYPDALVPGWYAIKETSQNVPGFVSSFTPVNFELKDTDLTSTGISLVIDNFYEKPVNKINLEKYISPNPLIVNQYDDFGNLVQLTKEPLDLAFKIEGVSLAVEPSSPGETSQIPGEPGYPGTEGYLKTIFWAELVNGKYPTTLTDLTPGDYTITEVGGNVPGYTGPAITVTMNGNPISNGGRFTIPADRDISLSFIFTDTYVLIPPPTPPPPTPEEPPPEKAPQTGVSYNLALPIVLLSLSAILFGGAEYGRRRYMKRKDK